jgi:hypothetical protein
MNVARTNAITVPTHAWLNMDRAADRAATIRNVELQTLKEEIIPMRCLENAVYRISSNLYGSFRDVKTLKSTGRTSPKFHPGAEGPWFQLRESCSTTSQIIGESFVDQLLAATSKASCRCLESELFRIKSSRQSIDPAAGFDMPYSRLQSSQRERWEQ